MRSLLFCVLLIACKKDDHAKPAVKDDPGAVERSPTERPSLGQPKARHATLPQFATVQREAAKDKLPGEANPPGAPVISGPVQEDHGVRFIDEKVGTGASPVKGKPVKVHYTGWLTDGTKFDSSTDRGEPIEFSFQGGMVIPGWDIGLSSMKVGGKRRLMIPADLAYGDGGAGAAIPAGALLVFDVELIDATN